MNTLTLRQKIRLGTALPGLVLVCGCGALLPKATPQPALYSLDGARVVQRSATTTSMPSTLSDVAPTLVVSPPRAAPGFDSPHIIYVRTAHRLEHFARSEWVDTPARMLAPLIVAALDNARTFRAVGLTTGSIAGELKLDTEMLRLQQEFGVKPSRVRFTLRAFVLDNATRRVIAWREFDETVASSSEDPYGGVVAANLVVQVVLERLATFCSEAAGLRPHQD